MLVKKEAILDEVVAVDTATVGVLRYVYKTLQFVGFTAGTTGTAKVFVGNDGNNWEELYPVVNSDTMIIINDVYAQLRVVINEYSAGTLSVILAAHE